MDRGAKPCAFTPLQGYVLHSIETCYMSCNGKFVYTLPVKTLSAGPVM